MLLILSLVRSYVVPFIHVVNDLRAAWRRETELNWETCTKEGSSATEKARGRRVLEAAQFERCFFKGEKLSCHSVACIEMMVASAPSGTRRLRLVVTLGDQDQRQIFKTCIICTT